MPPDGWGQVAWTVIWKTGKMPFATDERNRIRLFDTRAEALRYCRASADPLRPLKVHVRIGEKKV